MHANVLRHQKLYEPNKPGCHGQPLHVFCNHERLMPRHAWSLRSSNVTEEMYVSQTPLALELAGG
jgi:hypothetical protein